MKLLCSWFALAALWFCASAAARGSAPHSGEPSQAGGREYVRVTDWAKANGFQLRWLKRPESFQLSNASAKITCAVDSREAQVNGVGVWLSFPVARRDGVACLARLDLQTTVAPLLSPSKSKPGAALKSICLDSGHGRHGPGNCG